MTDPAEPGLNTEALQTVQRRNWTWTIVGVVAAMIVLVGLGWAAGTIVNGFALTPEEKALEEVQQAGDALTATAEGAEGAEATLTWSVAQGIAVLEADGLPTPGDDEEIAVWFRVGESYERTASFLPEDGAAMTVLTELWPDGAAVELSVDPVGGSSSGEPVADPLLSIQP
ncbi:anti-sigma factor domain-containing protein [Microbacterium sp. MC2]